MQLSSVSGNRKLQGEKAWLNLQFGTEQFKGDSQHRLDEIFVERIENAGGPIGADGTEFESDWRLIGSPRFSSD